MSYQPSGEPWSSQRHTRQELAGWLTDQIEEVETTGMVELYDGDLPRLRSLLRAAEEDPDDHVPLPWKIMIVACLLLFALFAAAGFLGAALYDLVAAVWSRVV